MPIRYLQFLFSLLELPFLPTYNDFQFKVKTKIDAKNEITFIGIGAIDQFELNLDANETLNQRYILSYLPVNEQWNYAIGLVYKHYRDNGYDKWVLSRNYLNNVSYKYLDNNESNPKTFDYSSAEIENKLRYERITNLSFDVKINYGLSADYSKYFNDTYNQLFIACICFCCRLEQYAGQTMNKACDHCDQIKQWSMPFVSYVGITRIYWPPIACLDSAKKTIS